MVRYRLEFAKRVKSDLKKIPQKYHARLESAFMEIKEVHDQGKPMQRELLGKFSWHVSVYRILYKPNKKDKVVTILKVEHRERAYS